MKMPSGQFEKGFIQLWSKPLVKEGGLGAFRKTGYDGLYLPPMSRYGLGLL